MKYLLRTFKCKDFTELWWAHANLFFWKCIEISCLFQVLMTTIHSWCFFYTIDARIRHRVMLNRAPREVVKAAAFLLRFGTGQLKYRVDRTSGEVDLCTNRHNFSSHYRAHLMLAISDRLALRLCYLRSAAITKIRTCSPLASTVDTTGMPRCCSERRARPSDSFR